MSSSVIDPNCFRVISASADAIGLLLIVGKMWNIMNNKFRKRQLAYSLVVRIFRKRQCARLAGDDGGFVGLHILQRVVD